MAAHQFKGIPVAPPAEITPLTAIDDGRLFNQFAAWLPDASLRQRILVENPARLYFVR